MPEVAHSSPAKCNPTPNFRPGYLSNRRPSVAIAYHISPTKEPHYGVPECSVLGAILFILDIPPLSNLIKRHTIIKSSKPTSCALDPIPTLLLLECLDDILPTLTCIINTSILSGQFQTNMKTAIVKPLLKNVL